MPTKKTKSKSNSAVSAKSTSSTRRKTKRKTKKEPSVSLNIVYALVVILLVSLFYNAYQHSEGALLTKYAHKAVNSEPILTGVSSEQPVLENEWAIYGEALGSVPGEVVFIEDNLEVTNEEPVSAEVVSWNNTQIVVKVPSELEFDTRYLVRVATTQMRDGSKFVFPIQWEENNVFEVLPNHYLYKVQPGDSLFKIAQNELGAEGRYLEIIELNKGQYPALSQYTPLGIGMELRLPNE